MSSTGREYSIPFSNLKVGEHVFELEIDDTFFDDFEYSEIKQGNIKSEIKLLKRTNMMMLDISIEGTVKTICDRCAAELYLPISSTHQLIVKAGEKRQAEDNDEEDIIYLSPSDNEIDLKQYLYEHITLALPIKREHETEEECDKEVIDRLKGVSIEEPENNDQSTDPRWDGLTDLKLN